MSAREIQRQERVDAILKLCEEIVIFAKIRDWSRLEHAAIGVRAIRSYLE